ncbi:MAG: GNAT family N-acetyltransferase [Parasphingopyxis sp.]|uniref:GNAT family N-acetyltransferase n=1 Tax=Parasphingopyxis sp. TaxID=1920299 RepID=UPI003FA18562
MIIETDRLILREWRDADCEPFAAMNADPEVMRYFPGVQSREESDAAAGRIATHFDEHGLGLFALEHKEDGTFIGFAGFQFVNFECPIEGDLEIGWRVARPYWRRGLAFEAASACMGWIWAESNVPRIVSMTATINAPSRNLMEKLGLTHRPELDFDHPKLDPDSPINRHVVYAMERPA